MPFSKRRQLMAGYFKNSSSGEQWGAPRPRLAPVPYAEYDPAETKAALARGADRGIVPPCFDPRLRRSGG